MRILDRRIAKLESERPKGRTCFVKVTREDVDIEAAIAEMGVDPGPNDTVFTVATGVPKRQWSPPK